MYAKDAPSAEVPNELAALLLLSSPVIMSDARRSKKQEPARKERYVPVSQMPAHRKNKASTHACMMHVFARDI